MEQYNKNADNKNKKKYLSFSLSLVTLLVGNGGSGNPRTNIPHKNELHKNTVLVFQDGY